MRILFAVIGLSALAAACDSHSTGKVSASDGAVGVDGRAGARNDALPTSDSAGNVRRTGSDAAPADVGSLGGAGSPGGTTATGVGGSGGADSSSASAAAGGASGRDGPTATGGPSTPDGSVAAGGTGGGSSAETTGSAGTTSAGGTSASAGKTATAGATGMGGTTATAGTSGTAGASGRGGTTATAGTSGAGGTTTTAGMTATAGTSATAGTTATAGTSGIATPADNVAQVSVDFGLPNIGYLNGLFATITICVPGTSTCQNVDHVLIDTGSSGLRVLGSVLTLSLPAWTNSSGVALAECTQFVDSFTWGPLRGADFSIAGEQANGLALQVIEESTYPVPSNCTGVANDTASTLRANGILGLSSFPQDCGSACSARLGRTSSNPGMYYTCTSAEAGGCQAAAVPVAKQLQNPVLLFSQDNNGTIIELPAISDSGATSVPGALVFGIGTRDNNGLGQASVLQLDDTGSFVTKYPTNGSSSSAFLDSGSNAFYFATSGSARIATCAKPYSGFYCPSSTLNLSATDQDAGGLITLTVNFSIANALALFANQDNVAFANVGGTSSLAGYFDWGLPFYFGKNVFTSIEGQTTPAGTAAFVAF